MHHDSINSIGKSVKLKYMKGLSIKIKLSSASVYSMC